eukprot:11168904-Lingulodinium_polyedra.AAC.1
MFFGVRLSHRRAGFSARFIVGMVGGAVRARRGPLGARGPYFCLIGLELLSGGKAPVRSGRARGLRATALFP